MSRNSTDERFSANGLPLEAAIDDKRGLRTHVLLVIAMALVIATITSISLLLVRHRLRSEITSDLTKDLNHSVTTFQDLQSVRHTSLDRETALLADLPTLKALMTSSDDLTIQDGAVEFWQLSGNDLFALADSSGRVVAAYTKGAPADTTLRDGLKALVASPQKRHLIDGSWLYACSVRPLYFGSQQNGTLLGYVISGISIERTVRQISQPTGAEATFLGNNHVVASTLNADEQASLLAQPAVLSGTTQNPTAVKIGNTRYLAATEDLTSISTAPSQLVVLKSFAPAEESINRIDRLVLIAGVLALLLGTALMIAVSRLVTRPLEELSEGVRAFGVGDDQYRIPSHGTQEVRQLSKSFGGMRDEIQQANRKLLESERLATIGRMASSVSHDFRHYLAAIYANSEFLASDKLSPKERAEIITDIRTAVDGTTEMIDSLLIFSRTGSSMRSSSELMATLLERAVSVVRKHPDADGIKLTTTYGDPTETAVFVEGKQIERAICNLLLNACQAVRSTPGAGNVKVTLEAKDRHMVLTVVDDGSGVPESIRESLFEPFVSEGKQKGTGLGLTLAYCIAAEHGGHVALLSSRGGETIFEMVVPCERRTPSAPAMLETEKPTKVLAG